MHETVAPFEKQRAQGMPGARRTRGLACENEKHTSKVTTGKDGFNRHSLRDGFNGFLRALPGDRAFLPPSSSPTDQQKLDISVGISGPHDFAVRESAARLAPLSRPRHPAPNVRDDREAPLFSGAGRIR
jgi:hypothetical protein